MKIYVGNLPYSVDENELKQLFEQHGEVSSAQIISDKHSGRSKGFGFVEMPDDAKAEAAIEALNNQDFQGRNIKVNKARPKTDRPDRPDRPRFMRR